MIQLRPAYSFLLLIAGFGAAACGGDSGTSPGPIPDLALNPVLSGLDHPLFVASPPGDQSRLFIVQRPGTIRILKNGALLSTPFLDITAKVDNGTEQGVLGLAFAPDYATSHAFYLHYVDPSLNVVISRFHAPSAAADVADTAEKVLITVPQIVGDHNGGMLAFGKDGYLYASLGDGGCCGDPGGHGQDRTDLLGSMIRLDVSGNGNYAIPPTNPWATDPTFRHELWNYGLRNPWRFSFDRVTGDLYIGDVGEGAREEIDVTSHTSTGGENYGWRITEGSECYGGTPCDSTGITMPVLDYDHSAGCAVMGGYVYRGAAIPALRGTYFYADFCSGWIRSFRWGGGKTLTEKKSWDILPAGEMPNSFGEDAAGELYVTTEGGGLYRLVAK